MACSICPLNPVRTISSAGRSDKIAITARHPQAAPRSTRKAFIPSPSQHASLTPYCSLETNTEVFARSRSSGAPSSGSWPSGHGPPDRLGRCLAHNPGHHIRTDAGITSARTAQRWRAGQNCRRERAGPQSRGCCRNSGYVGWAGSLVKRQDATKQDAAPVSI
jgi:hypothetical protein